MISLQLFGGGGGSSWGKGFKDITHPNARDKGHREYKNEGNGIHYRYDPERGKNPAHYHVFNPHWTSNEDMYLDRDGKPAPRHSEDAALTKEEFEKLIQKIIRREI